MYYGIITIASLMFSMQFLFNQRFEKECGSSTRSSLIFTIGSSLAGTVLLLIINKFRFEFTLFTLVMSVVSSLNGLLYTICSMKAFGKINLSLYSIFAMLGGMALPFVAGILFFDEALTIGKSVCFVLIAVSLFLTFERGKNKNGLIYYVGIFVLNGMSGVLAKIFQTAPYEKTSDAGYSILCAVVTVVMTAIMLLFTGGPKIIISVKSALNMFCNGTLGRVANYLLLIALAHLPASAQHPMITGGVMIFSTVICFFTPNKPSKREIISIIISFAGIIALITLP